ncbi:hypothetical protein U0X57_28825 [Bacillus thuringiensis]|uniref:hypothetical protein n=1 Tax=Bacillus cereus group TaxID=86661 RepID=UPI001298E38E|nr:MULTISPECIES: hypothetical protein [Bacillus cereus group]MEB8953052.1 hypothetical protein [Bacillus cereus]MCR6806138.1 hypothetical protein [Bacillus thuringiensis]MCR6835780.1 hypothetical protein [Bacillus thuringiensis]MCR6841260.1 hypothetical protein [Bacillus thuringiensis]MCR6876190.1 hypothetical protein [Bacillus thuringiensis]
MATVLSLIQPVTTKDLIQFLQYAFHAGEDVLFLAFVLMITFSVAISIRRIMVGYKQS